MSPFPLPPQKVEMRIPRQFAGLLGRPDEVVYVENAAQCQVSRQEVYLKYEECFPALMLLLFLLPGKMKGIEVPGWFVVRSEGW